MVHFALELSSVDMKAKLLVDDFSLIQNNGEFVSRAPIFENVLTLRYHNGIWCVT